MHLIKVNAINSTNSFVRELFREKAELPMTCVVAKKQLQGRGQRGTIWDAEEGKNLTFSVFFPRPGVAPASQFLISATVAVSLIRSLEKFDLPRLKVKWPNDILSANRKVAGILIENILSEGKIAGSVIGIGLNVNQEEFPELPQAGSMKMMTGQEQDLDLDLVLETILKDLEQVLENFSERQSGAILKTYEKCLFRRTIPSTFQLPSGQLFTGIIHGVTAQGKLLVRDEDEKIREFDLKEVSLRY
ncbi:biotin--[acetyl-CoA-carboxylase] ligase [Salinimicrobium oceani]|uniref:Biotin--[acetyl-CoA-carboxylase] ligase n=1 Tax=Salinimicrobium oceani TaxID=2722702 RepID=A0ABX1CVS0_9FLAO|nr:biotin--[acetyl-CoA-carboxylase] ligase [Salinimicrobium oceani]NJW51847.1 biotin--[acetyl-CoA-carboxylase] ligase [Salinimicrobium oceani]